MTAFIKAQLNNQTTDVAVGEVLAQLKQGGMLTLPDGKVTYPPAYQALLKAERATTLGEDDDEAG